VSDDVKKFVYTLIGTVLGLGILWGIIDAVMQWMRNKERIEGEAKARAEVTKASIDATADGVAKVTEAGVKAITEATSIGAKPAV